MSSRNLAGEGSDGEVLLERDKYNLGEWLKNIVAKFDGSDLQKAHLVYVKS